MADVMHSTSAIHRFRDRDNNIAVGVLGKGFIGSAITRALFEDNIEVHAVSSRECNLLESAQVEAFLRNLPQGSRIVFCAAISRIVEDSYDAFLRNIQMVQNFVSAAARGHLGGVVYLSSVDVYGRCPTLPITERTLPAPASYYGLSKLACEFLLRRPGALDCPLTILRLPGIYGPGDRGRSVVGRFLNQMEAKGHATIYGDGSVLRDFVEVGDVCQVIRCALAKPFDGVLNVATGTSLPIREVVETLAEVGRPSPTIAYESEDVNAAGDLVFDVGALHAILSPGQLKSLREGAASYAALVAGEAAEPQFADK